MNLLRYRLCLGVIFVLALMLRLLPLRNPGIDWAIVQVDSWHYTAPAEGLRAGCGYAAVENGKCGTAETRFPPGYSVFLTTMPTLRTAVAFQALMGAIVCLITAVVVAWFWDYWTALLAATLMAFDLASVATGAAIVAEQTFQLTLAALILSVAAMILPSGKSRVLPLATIAGILLALAVMIRPTGIFVPIAVVATILIMPISWRSRIISLLIVSLLPAAAAIGWTERNVSCCHIHTIANSGANDLYRFKAAAVVAFSEHESFEQAQHQLDLALPPNVHAGTDPDELERRAIRIFREHPVALAFVTTKGVAVLLFAPAGSFLSRLFGLEWRAPSPGLPKDVLEPTLSSLSTSPSMLALVTFQIGLCILVAFGIVFALINVREMNHAQKELVLICTLMTVVLLAPNAGGAAKFRMRTHAEPAMVILAAIGLRRAFALVSNIRRGPRRIVYG
jgi:4-amino-4-deoxy-L-arabinose transferase-like glycosyltransferase